MNKKEYSEIVKENTPKSPYITNCLKAFVIGGLICTIGQALLDFYKYLGADEQTASSAVSISLIFLSVLLTGLNIYPKIAKHAGAGTLVPITGFANAVASPAIESKTEGLVLGIGVKIFSVSGPVILFGTIASVIAGLILWFF